MLLKKYVVVQKIAENRAAGLAKCHTTPRHIAKPYYAIRCFR